MFQGNDGTGLRIYHIDSKLINQYGDGSTFKYEGFSSYYDTTGNGIRVIRLVNDGNGFLRRVIRLMQKHQDLAGMTVMDQRLWILVLQ